MKNKLQLIVGWLFGGVTACCWWLSFTTTPKPSVALLPAVACTLAALFWLGLALIDEIDDSK